MLRPMSIGPLVPCIWLDDDAERAAELYTRTFPATRVVASSRYPESIDNPGHKRRGSVLTVEMELAGLGMTLLNGGPQFKPDPSLSFFFFAKERAEVEAIFRTLLDGGAALMPLDKYPWSECYAWVQDRFGVSWQLMLAPEDAGGVRVMPCLMFSGTQHGHAGDAIGHYVRALGGEMLLVDRYTEADPGPVGTVKHGRFVVAGTKLAAMDAHLQNDVRFSEALSLQVMCDDQSDVDRVWAALTDGGREGPCGWLTDRFGFSWQVVPRSITSWMTSKDAAARDRAFQAMLPMMKLDVATLQRAFEGP